jgi:hypothetical protein
MKFMSVTPGDRLSLRGKDLAFIMMLLFAKDILEFRGGMAGRPACLTGAFILSFGYTKES